MRFTGSALFFGRFFPDAKGNVQVFKELVGLRAPPGFLSPREVSRETGGDSDDDRLLLDGLEGFADADHFGLHGVGRSDVDDHHVVFGAVDEQAQLVGQHELPGFVQPALEDRILEPDAISLKSPFRKGGFSKDITDIPHIKPVSH